jgi:hypothetical protein
MHRRWLSLVLALSAFACSEPPPNHDTEAQCGCVAEPVRLTALDAPLDQLTTISPCRTFALSVGAIADRPAGSCVTQMICPPKSGGGLSDAAAQVTGIDVARAVANPDVQEAVRAGTMRYGAGPGTPGGGGPLYGIGVSSVDFEVGGPCGSLPCTPVPDGVQHLLDVLLAVNAQEIIRSPCREMLQR